MHFDWGGKRICWKGEPWVDVNPLTTAELKSLLSTTNEAFMCYMEMNDVDTVQPPTQTQENQKVTDLLTRKLCLSS